MSSEQVEPSFNRMMSFERISRLLNHAMDDYPPESVKVVVFGSYRGRESFTTGCVTNGEWKLAEDIAPIGWVDFSIDTSLLLILVSTMPDGSSTSISRNWHGRWKVEESCTVGRGDTLNDAASDFVKSASTMLPRAVVRE